MLKKSSVYIFIKAQFSAFLGGVADFIIMVACTELLQIHYTVSIVIGGILGAFVNFTINRNWTFEANGDQDKNNITLQLVKFTWMVGGSILLKSSGTYLVTEISRIDYRISRVLIDVFVSLGFNYTLQKYWVFRKSPLKRGR